MTKYKKSLNKIKARQNIDEYVQISFFNTKSDRIIFRRMKKKCYVGGTRDKLMNVFCYVTLRPERIAAGSEWVRDEEAWLVAP